MIGVTVKQLSALFHLGAALLNMSIALKLALFSEAPYMGLSVLILPLLALSFLLWGIGCHLARPGVTITRGLAR